MFKLQSVASCDLLLLHKIRMWKSSRRNRTRAVFTEFLPGDFSAPTTSRAVPSPSEQQFPLSGDVMKLNTSSSSASSLTAGSSSLWVAALVILIVHMWSYLNLGFIGVWTRSLVASIVSIASRIERGRSPDDLPDEPSALWLASEVAKVQASLTALDRRVDALGGSFQELSKILTTMEKKSDGHRSYLTGVKAELLLQINSVGSSVDRCRREIDILDKHSVALEDWMRQEFEVSAGYRNFTFCVYGFVIYKVLGCFRNGCPFALRSLLAWRH